MPTLDTLLVVGCAGAALLWLGVSAYVLAVQRRRSLARTSLASATALLRRDDVRRLPLADRVAALRPVIEGASRDMVMHGAADSETAPGTSEALTAYLVERWGVSGLEREAASHHGARSKWRRIAALRILSRVGHPRHIELLAQAADQADGDVAAIAFSLLGRLEDPRAGETLIGALTRQQHPASRVAVHLDRSPIDLADRLRPLMRDANPVIRLWAAMLLGRYTGVDGLERDLVSMVDDPDARVRKAAIESLGRIGDELAAAAACRLVRDPVAFVRANAARALGRLDRPDLAGTVATLLGDRDWWVRFAAKQALEAMGADVWPVLVRCLEHADRFVRNGAAEVVQNLGLLDSLIVMEAATDDPAAQKIDMLRRIASAGGVRLTDSLVERAGPTVGPRVRRLLATIGFEDVGAA
jgi:HEAT repeat protein